MKSLRTTNYKHTNYELRTTNYELPYMKLRIFFGIVGILATIVFAGLVIVAVDSRGKISREEFAGFSIIISLFASFVASWAFWAGDNEDAKDARPPDPL